MKQSLRLAPAFSLPLDAATRRLAILAMSGAGKSNVAVVMAEQMFDAGIPWVAIDPKGDWYGVRVDGERKGLPIPILGGLHGDVPLEPTAGKVVAEMIIAERMTCVLDVSEFDNRQDLWRFLIDLGETLLRKNTQPLHLFLEEADEYLPQRTNEKGNAPRCLGVWQRVCKKGRTRGLGTTQITQRNASLNKDTLYQAECLIAMRCTGKGDREAVKGWVEHHGAAAEIVASLSGLGDGEGWVSSPAWLRKTERVHFNRRRTFDSGATPVLEQGTTPPATLATVDLAALSERMAATIERAKADDPAELKKQIAGLRKTLASAVANREMAADSVPRRVYDAEVAARVRLEEQTMSLRNVLESLGKDAVGIAKSASSLAVYCDKYSKPDALLVRVREQTATERIAEGLKKGPTMRLDGMDVPMERTEGPLRYQPAPKIDASLARGLIEDFEKTPKVAALPPRQQRFLDAAAALSTLGAKVTRESVCAWLGVHPRGGSVGEELGRLAYHGLIKLDRGQIEVTERGMACAEPMDPAKAIENAKAGLSGRQRKFFELIERAYPGTITREAIAAEFGIHPRGGSLGEDLGRLVGRGLIENNRGAYKLREFLVVA